MQEKSWNREILFKYIIYAIGIFALCYSGYRAVVLAITHDEAYTHIMCVPLSLWDVITYENNYNANNHILNTLLMKLSIAAFGNAEWALRLPNIFGHFLYVFFSVRIVKSTFSWTYLGLLAMILLNFNPYLIDFFSVARGYGLAMGMMLSSVYFLLSYLKNKELKYWITSLLFGFLAVWSNFIYLLYFVTLVAIYAVVELERYWRSNQDFKMLTRGQIPSVLATLFIASVIITPFIKLRELKEFRYGGSSSFFHDTYTVLLDYCLYSNRYFGAGTDEFFLVSILILLVSSSLLIIFCHLKSKELMMQNPSVLFLLFGLFLMFISIVQHHLLGAAYLTDRRAIIFLPFAGLVLCGGLLYLEKYAKVVSISLGMAIIIFSSFHFIYNIKTYDTIRQWSFDRDTKEILSIMKREATAMNKSTVKLEVDFLMKNSFNFYQRTREIDWLQRMQYQTNKVQGEGADFYYIFDKERPIITDQVDTLFYSKGRMLLRSLPSE